MKDDDKKNAALRCIGESPVRALQTWRHNGTGGTYVIVAVGLDEPTLEPAVTYVDADGVVWTRQLAVFLGEKDGKPRFTQLDDDDKPRASAWRPTDGFEEYPTEAHS